MAARTARVWARIATGARLGPLSPSALPMRVLPGDLDLNLHLTNSRYLMLMDLGRLELFGRMGFISVAARRGWRPMVGAVSLRFRRGLAPFERFELRSRVLCWDAKWVYVEQAFVSREQVATVALLRLIWRGAQGNVPTAVQWEAVGQGGAVSPEMPEEVVRWVASLKAGREEAPGTTH